MVKNGHVHEAGKVRRSNATPTKFFNVDSYDLTFLSFNFGYDIFITFKCQGILHSDNFENEHFIAIPFICNQRSLNRLSKK